MVSRLRTMSREYVSNRNSCHVSKRSLTSSSHSYFL
ncbi:hypothetical protein Celaphus_00015843 [Cervus elaphus hippelaphus]|uniref:Uncharacterized protein n=1 Tax=Cervus elaphus hippelaphus TaxID=46360 RepID=A0A212C1C5_CEREH|nr:hypothetical protein Celaphus_00015843 [Cervus elaphus hippelaphus]